VNTTNIAVKSNQWTMCLDYMSHRIKQQSFNTWLKPTKGRLSENGDFVVTVRNQFVCDWLQNHFRDLIVESITEVLGQSHNVAFELNSDNAKDQASLELYDNHSLDQGFATTNVYGNGRPASNLNDRYDFKSLVVGDFNEFAYAAV